MNELAKALLIKRNNKTLNFFVKNATSSAINLGFSSFKELLINDSTLVVSDILNFVKKGNDVGLLIKKPFAWNVSYEVDQRPPVVSFSEIIDIDGLMTSAPSLRANSPGDSYFFRNLIANNASIKNRGFRRSRGLNIVAINNANSLGDTVGDDEVFSDQSFVKANRLIVPASFETNNNGNPDGDIVVNNNNGGVTVYAQNYDKPPTPTNIQTTQVGGTFAELDFTLPTHVNDYLGYMIFSNGFYIAFIENITNFFAVGLNPSSINRVELRLVDEFFNISEPARFSVLTPAIDTTALFQNAVAYYKLDETSGNAIDVKNGFNGTLFGGVTQGVAGKIGTAYSFDGTGYINCGAIDYNEIQVSCWFKTNDNSQNSLYFFGQGVQSQGRVLRLRIVNGVISSPIFGGVVEFGNNTFNDGNWHLISFSLPSKTSNTSQFELRVDNVLQPISSHPNINMNIDTTQPFIIGASNNLIGFVGEIDEFFINNNILDLPENSDLYNNGNGTTI